MGGLFETFPYTNFQDLNLDFLLTNMKLVLKELQATENTVNNFVSEYGNRISELENYIKELEKGNFSPAFLKSLYTWLNKNVPSILRESVKNVWFSLDTNGRLVVNVPDSWKNLVFKTTGYDIEIGNILLYPFGHLVILEQGGK